ncbi:MAG: hypothetical protein ACLTER_16865 [Ruminococcus sp.]
MWAMTGMAAAQMGDINNLLELIRNYETEYCENRKYRYIQAKQDGFVWNVRNCIVYMKEK